MTPDPIDTETLHNEPRKRKLYGECNHCHTYSMQAKGSKCNACDTGVIV